MLAKFSHLLNSLRSRLVLLILFAVLPALFIILLSGLRYKNYNSTLVKSEALSVVRIAAESQKQMIEGAKQLLIALSQLPQVEEGNPRECNLLFEEILAQFPAYANLGAANSDGDIYCSGLPLSRPVNIADRAYFQHVTQTQSFAIGEYQIGRITGKPSLNVAYPLLDDVGQVKGIIFAALDLQWLNQLVSKAQLPRGSTITVIDQYGAILARHPYPEQFVGRVMPEIPFIQTILKTRGEGTAETAGLDGVLRLYAFEPLVDTQKSAGNVYLVIGVPVEVAHAMVNHILAGSLTILVVVVALALLAGWIGFDVLLLRHLNTLRKATRRLSSGDLDARANLYNGPDELKELGVAFDQMGESLEQQMHERERAEKRVRMEAQRAEALVRVASLLNAQLDLNTVLDIVCVETARALNVPAAGVTLLDEKTGQLYVAADFGQSPEFRQNHQPIPIQVLEQLFSKQESAYLLEDVPATPDFPQKDMYSAFDIRTLAVTCMLRQGQVVGTLNIFAYREVRHFSDDELSLLKALADQASQAIVNARLFEGIREQASQLGMLYDVGLAINSILEPRAQLEHMLQIELDLLRANTAEFLRFDSDSNKLHFEFGLQCKEKPLPVWKDISVPLDETTPEGWVATNRVPLRIPDTSPDANQFAIAGPGHQAALWVPVNHKQRLIGVFGFARTNTEAFTPQDERLLLLFANQAAVALENTRLLEEVKRNLSQVQALREIDVAITGSMDMRVTLRTVVDQAITHLNVDAADILVLSPHLRMLEYVTGKGFRTAALQHTHPRWGEGYAGQAALEQRIIHVPNLQAEPDGLTRSKLLLEEEFVEYFSVPLLSKGRVKGVLEIFQRASIYPDQDWLDFLQTLAGQAAIAIENAQLFNDLQRAKDETVLAYDATIEGWSRALDLRDHETEGHSQRVTEMTIRLARLHGINGDELIHIRRGALLHDIGKMGIPDKILLKPGSLNEEE